ncbi:hypothetical protein ACWEVD_30935 [Nocardia thailandica]
MTAFLALATAALVGTLAYRAYPRRHDPLLRLFRFRPHDRATADYGDLRAYQDLSAAHARFADTTPAPSAANGTREVQFPKTGLIDGPTGRPTAA